MFTTDHPGPFTIRELARLMVKRSLIQERLLATGHHDPCEYEPNFTGAQLPPVEPSSEAAPPITLRAVILELLHQVSEPVYRLTDLCECAHVFARHCPESPGGDIAAHCHGDELPNEQEGGCSPPHEFRLAVCYVCGRRANARLHDGTKTIAWSCATHVRYGTNA